MAITTSLIHDYWPCRDDLLKLLLAFLVLIIYKYRSNAIGSRPRGDLIEPKGAVPLLGHLLLLATVPPTEIHEFFLKQYRELGPVWSITLPIIGRLIQIETPENYEHVVKTGFWNYVKGPLFADAIGAFVGPSGLVLTEGVEFKVKRRLVSQIFHVKAFHNYTSDVFVVQGKRLNDHLGKAADEGTAVDFQHLIDSFALDSIGGVIFGRGFGCLDDINHKVPFEVSLKALLEISGRRLFIPFWRIHEPLTGVDKKVQHHNQVMEGHIQNLIDERRRDGHSAQNPDLLQLLLEAKDDDGQPLTDDVLISNLMTMVVAGHETTAQALTWMLYFLLCENADKDIITTLVKEVDDALQALRLSPPLPRALRQCVRDDVLPDGTRVYAGEYVTWGGYVMGRSESIWGPDALEYKPSRWLGSVKPSANKFVSFHGGPRVCVGQQFAILQAQTIVALIFQSFEVSLEDPAKIATYAPSLTLPIQGGLKIRLKRRRNGGETEIA
ncbi:hypothetical protein CPB97_004471 [Podila verticillata]|nr:hypothetical protein CPB97_004471 [Podila verticillata]